MDKDGNPIKSTGTWCKHASKEEEKRETSPCTSTSWMTWQVSKRRLSKLLMPKDPSGFSACEHEDALTWIPSSATEFVTSWIAFAPQGAVCWRRTVNFRWVPDQTSQYTKNAGLLPASSPAVMQQQTPVPSLLPYGFTNPSPATMAAANGYVRTSTELALSVKSVVITNYAAMQAEPSTQKQLSEKSTKQTWKTWSSSCSRKFETLDSKGPDQYKIPWTPKETTATTAASQDTSQNTVENEWTMDARIEAVV